MKRTTGVPLMETPPGSHAQNMADVVTTRLRLFFLAPLTAVIFGVVILLVFQLHVREQREIEHDVRRVQLAFGKMYKDNLAHDTDILHVVMEIIHSNPALRKALAHRDRTQLLALTKSFFPGLKDKFGITHLYFSGPDRVNLLRVHQPDRSGDIINRHTTIEAERTGMMTSGVELGPLGTFTLRMVHPWYADGSHRLIGYVELGMEIDGIIQGMQDSLGAPVFVLISKQFLRRGDWEVGMKMLGHVPEWERFPGVVLGSQAALPPAVAVKLTGGLPRDRSAVLEAVQDSTVYRLALSPLNDAADRAVGEMAVLIDVTRQVIEARRAVWLGLTFALVSGGALFAFFWWLIGRIGRRIGRNEQVLQDHATHDRLTGAWNRLWFDEMLAREIKRARRYALPLSLVMFDIDHFKNVNDTWGHQAGDNLLAALSVYVNAHVRDTDALVRWGGEEFMLVVPNTDLEAARRLAANLRALIERGNFGEVGQITCSFGVAQFQAGDTPEDFTKRVDFAMYQAKQEGRNRVCCDAITGPLLDGAK